MTSPALLGCGNPLLDISAEVPQSFLDKYDVKVNNAILAEEKHLPMYEELKSSFPAEFIAGGATQNSIRVAQWMLPAGSTAYIGCIGKDDFGNELKRAVAADGVAAHYLEDETTPTGTCAVVVNGKERGLVANLGAANKYQASHLENESVWNVVKGAKVVYIAGFFLTVSPPSIMKIASEAKEANKAQHGRSVWRSYPDDFQPSDAELQRDFTHYFTFFPIFFDAMMKAMPLVDILFGNEDEAAAFAKANKWDTTDIKEIARKASELPSEKNGRMVVFTQGASATIVARDGKVEEFAVSKIDPDQIVDTNGAGDAFVGGFLSQLVLGKPLETSVAAGHYAAGVIICRSGCTFPEKPSFP